MKPANLGPFYAAGLYPRLAEVFRRHGYALAVHGSVASDFDLIAAPWTPDAADPDLVIAEVVRLWSDGAVEGEVVPSLRPHGRRAYKVHLSFGACSLDISVMPRLPAG